ncbi:MFS transporter [Xanthobacter autotrophicus]|uniref:MFS transporter n=1 Tax=Xanthobacter autotrophicus TaxID=280 RepID=UPI0024A64AEB|nr:MFS transporter [Xanthobacter autotrophicus]MDI4656989.1 MFS transporter [Xanthobacter autotrophicus]
MTGPAIAQAMPRRRLIRQVALLSAAQALFQTASVMVMTVAGLAGAAITPAPELATLPVAAMFLGTAIGIAPASLWMARVGRRIGFVAGALLGTLGGLLGALGIFYASLPLLCLGTGLVGTYQAFAQFYRFAAAEVATDAFRPRAISFVLAGGVVAAIAGPILGRFGGPLLAADYAGSFLILAVVSLLAAGLLLGVDMPRPARSASSGGRPLGAIIRQPAYLVALFGAATGYGVMILAMTATPLAMLHHHHDLSDAATVIQLHVLGMFLPSFFTGALISRFGVLKVMLAGAFLLAGHVLIALSGTQFLAFASALVLLGVGWNFLFIGGTTLLTRCYAPGERARAQAANDLVIFIVGVATSLGAGAMLYLLGWQIMNAVLLPWLALAVLALVWLGWRERRG